VEAYVSKGHTVVEMMGRLPYACSLVSNMEFTFGSEVLRARTVQAKFPYLTSNLTFSDPVVAGKVKREVIVEAAGLKIALLGFSPANLKQICAPEVVARVNVDPELAPLVKRAAELKRGEVDLVVLLTKLPTDSPPDGVKKALGSSAIDLVLGIDYAQDGGAIASWGNTLVAGLPSDNRGSRLKVIELTFDGARRIVAKESSVEVIGPESCPADPEIEKILGEFQSHVMAAYKEKIGLLTSPLTKGWKDESTLGDLICDQMRAVTGAQVAMINSGAIQDDIPAGDVTLRDVLQALPFDNSITSIEVTGAKLREGLASQLKRNNTFQVSGMTYRARDDAEGNAILLEVTVGGRPLESARTYTLAITDFALGGVEAFQPARPILKGTVRDVVLKAIRSRSSFDPKPDGRVGFARAPSGKK
jgi:2',3'-cyclic-nucleotide 2'-phosphodiesterase/3'-nucleotidase